MSERLSRIYIASAAGKVVTLFNRVILVPWVAVAVKAEDFAVYMLLLSAVAFLSGLDVGIGGGTLSQISKAYADKNYSAIGMTAFRAYRLTVLLCILFLIAGSLIHLYMGEKSIGLPVLLSICADTWLAGLELSAVILIQCVFNMSMRIMQGIAHQSTASLMGGFVNGSFALAIVLFVGLSSDRLRLLSQLTLILSALAQVIAIVFCIVKIKRLAERTGSPSPNGTVTTGLSASLPFAFIAFSAFLERDGLKWLVGSTGDMVMVGRLSIYSQIMLGIIGIVQMLLMPFWPLLLNTSAERRQQVLAVRRALRIAIAIGIAIFFLGFGISVLGQRASIQMWGDSYGWTQNEWNSVALYAVCSCPKHLLFPILLGFAQVRFAALSYFAESTLLGIYFVVAREHFVLANFFYFMCAVNLVVSTPVFLWSTLSRYNAISRPL